MNTKKLNELFLENWGQKIICIVLAVVLYVFNRAATLEKKVFTVPLKVEATGLMMPYSDIPRYVKVTVRTKPENLPGINNSNLFASVKLNDFTEVGEYKVPVFISLSEELMLLEQFEYSVKPEFINVELDTKELAYIPLKPALSGEVEHGYTISKIEVSPSSVKVVGPSKIVKKTKFIDTKKVIVSGAATNFSQDVKLDNINQKLKVIPESDFKVTVTVIPANDTKLYTNIIPSVTNLSDDFELQSDIPLLSFKVASTVPVLEKYSPDSRTVILDCSSIDASGTFEIPVNIRVPSNMSLVEKSLETVSVTVVEKIKETPVEPEKNQSVTDFEDSYKETGEPVEEKAAQ